MSAKVYRGRRQQRRRQHSFGESQSDVIGYFELQSVMNQYRDLKPRLARNGLQEIKQLSVLIDEVDSYSSADPECKLHFKALQSDLRTQQKHAQQLVKGYLKQLKSTISSDDITVPQLRSLENELQLLSQGEHVLTANQLQQIENSAQKVTDRIYQVKRAPYQDNWAWTRDDAGFSYPTPALEALMEKTPWKQNRRPDALVRAHELEPFSLSNGLGDIVDAVYRSRSTLQNRGIRVAAVVAALLSLLEFASYLAPNATQNIDLGNSTTIMEQAYLKYGGH